MSRMEEVLRRPSRRRNAVVTGPGLAVWLVLVAALTLVTPATPATLLAQSNPDPRPEPLPSVELPSELDRVLRDYERHWSAGDAEALSELFVEDGFIVRRGTWIRGRTAIRTAYRNASGPLRLRAVEFGTEGTLGYILGAYGYAEEGPVDDQGLFTLTLRRSSSGTWLIISDMDRGAA